MSSIKKEGAIWTYYSRVGGRQVHRSLQTGDQHIALQRQKVLDDELATSRWPTRRVTWKAFIDAYTAWSAPRKAKATCANEKTTIEEFERLMAPKLLTDITSETVETYLTRITSEHTVVWSRPPSDSPIWGSDAPVASRKRYIAIWRGVTTSLLRPRPFKSSALMR